MANDRKADRVFRPVTITGTFDIECAEWDRFVVGATYDGSETKTYRDPGDLADALMSSGGVWWAHAGGAYDLLQIAEVYRSRGIRCVAHMSGSRISRLVGGGVILADSFLLAPMGLERLSTVAGLSAIRDLGWECNCRERCGGYCAITPRMPPDRMRQLEAYCAHDAQVLYHSLQTIVDHAAGHQIIVKGTLGQTAWATARERCGLPDADLPPRIWDRCKEGYYGGRVLAARRYATHGDHYDLASAYPAALARTALPVGCWSEVGSDRASALYRGGKPGVYRATVRVPNCFAPPLPIRYGDRIGYPTGRFTTTVAANELAQAESCGAMIEKVHGGIVWETEAILFGDLIDDWYGIRMSVGRETALGDWYASLGRSLTGKLAESPEREFVRMHPGEIKICSGRWPCSRTRCDGRCNAYRQLDLWGQLWAVPCYRLNPCAHIAWAAYLTAATRISLLRGFHAVGDDLCYADTDSIWTKGLQVPGQVGDDLGQWRRKGSFGDFECLAPKVYRYLDRDGNEWIRASGIRKMSHDEWRTAVDGDPITRERGVMTLKEAAAHGSGKLFRRRARTWLLGQEREWYGDRRLDISSGVTYPVDHEQLQARYQAPKATVAKADGTESVIRF